MERDDGQDMGDSANAKAIARKLTEAQREMLLGFVRWTQSGCVLCQGRWRTGEALERRGITSSIRTLTPLGLAVRQHLQPGESK